MDLSGYVDGYYSFNFNRPNTTDGFDQLNQLYNFNDKTDQFELSAAKLTLNHSPDPIGAHVDFIYGRTNDLINAAPSNTTSTLAGPSQLPYIEQAFLSLKPPKAKGFELDFGRFVTSAGAEVIEAKDNWNYSRSLSLWAIPYWHFGLRTSMPVSKTETIGVQVVNGWNVLTKNNGWHLRSVDQRSCENQVHVGFQLYTGPENALPGHGYRNLVDTTAAHAARKIQRLHQLRLGTEQDDSVVGTCGTATAATTKSTTGKALPSHSMNSSSKRPSLAAMNTSPTRKVSRLAPLSTPERIYGNL
jgi:hypothetical protein